MSAQTYNDKGKGNGDDRIESLPVVAIAREAESRRWLVEGLWSAAAVGIIGGAPKSCKSWLGLDMAVSVASGSPCLGGFSVRERGRALVYLAEDSLPDQRERVRMIAAFRGLALEGLDLHVLTCDRLRLDEERDRRRLFETVRELAPRFLLLDPLVRLHGVNENDAREISELLSYLRDLQRQLDVAIALVHHARKSGSPAALGGQGLRGSGDLWAWGDSNLYLRRSGQGKISLSMEHRSAPAPDPVCLRLDDADGESVHLELEAGSTSPRGDRILHQDILEALAGGETLTRNELRQQLRVRNETLGEALATLELEGLIARAPGGWRQPSRSTES